MGAPLLHMVLDFENYARLRYDPSMTLAWAEAFIQRVHDTTGRWLGLYGGSYLKQQFAGTADTVLTNCWLWIAEYFYTSAPPTAVPEPIPG